MQQQQRRTVPAGDEIDADSIGIDALPRKPLEDDRFP